MRTRFATSEQKLRYEIGRVIFTRIAAQMSGTKLADEHWDVAYDGWIENPALFPLVETCIDAAEEIRRLNAEDDGAES